MKTTLDLPAGLMKRVKLRARRGGRKLKDTVADLLRKGLAASAAEEKKRRSSVRITRHKLTGLPVIKYKSTSSTDVALIPNRVTKILLEQEAEWFNGSGG